MSGAFWAIAAAMVFSLSHIAIRKAIGTLGVLFGTTVMLTVSAITVWIAAIVIDDMSVLTSATTAGVLYFAAFGLIHFVGGWGLMNATTRSIGAARMSAITGITPLFAGFLAIITLQESLNAFLGLGIVMIVVGTYFIATG